jgi:ribonuclease BN (tRNA processing enzyme)
VQGPGLRLVALGTAGAPAPGRMTTSYLLSDGVLIDTGAAAHTIPHDRRALLSDILLSHTHLDHTLGLPFLIGRQPITVHGLESTLDCVRSSLLNGAIWPDISKHAAWNPIAEGDHIDLGDWTIEVGPASHSVPCVSFFCRNGNDAVFIAGDTRLDEAVLQWAAARHPTDCIVECSFEDGLAELASKWGHQTPRDLRAWRKTLGPSCRIGVTHIKPLHESLVRAECEALHDENLRTLHDGDVILS